MDGIDALTRVADDHRSLIPPQRCRGCRLGDALRSPCARLRGAGDFTAFSGSSRLRPRATPNRRAGLEAAPEVREANGRRFSGPRERAPSDSAAHELVAPCLTRRGRGRSSARCQREGTSWWELPTQTWSL